MQKRFVFLFLACLLFAGCAERPSTPAVPAETPVPAQDAAPSGSEESEPGAYRNIVLTLRRDGETLLERPVTDPAEVTAVQEIVFDFLVKSAAWEGVEASELESCIALSFDPPAEGERQVYYQYDTDGKHVLQAGEAGMYSIMSDGAYTKLLRLAGLSPQ